MATNDSIASEFDVHLLNDQGLQKAREIAVAFSKLVTELDRIGIPGGRSRAIMITELQKASMFAKRAMAEDQANQLPATDTHAEG